MSLHITAASRLNSVEEYYFSKKLKQIAALKVDDGLFDDFLD